MLKDSHKKIALVTISLAGGGAERSVAGLSKMLTSLGHEVHVISINDAIAYSYHGQLLNLGQYKKRNSFFGILKSLQVFRRYLKEHAIDVVIDHRTRSNGFKEWVYANFIYKNIPLILVAHSANLEMYFSAKGVKVYNNVKSVIGVSKRIAQKISKQLSIRNIRTIHNAIPELESKTLTFQLPPRYILSYGRMVDEVKNYRLLLDAFAKAYTQIQTSLILMGDGPDVQGLKDHAETLNIQDVVLFLPNVSAPKAIVENALCVTLTSRFEGFPMVLVEALSLGVPVVSVDCDSGPAELITHEKNGLLVKNHDVPAFAQALTRISTDATLRQQLASQAKSSVSFLETDSIAAQWEKLLSSIL